MLQSFAVTASPEQGPPRLAKLRKLLKNERLAGYLVPRADAHQGEYIASCDARLAWLTGFTGSAGFCAVLQDIAGVFVDGRYRTQVKEQVDTGYFTPVDWPETKLADWLCTHLPRGGKIGYNPWLHTAKEIEALEKELEGSGITLSGWDDVIANIWADRPDPPIGPVRVYPEDLAGEPHNTKRTRLAQNLADTGKTGAILTLPDSIAWLLNIRGADIPRTPIPHAFAVLHCDACVTLYIDARKIDDTVRIHLGDEITIKPYHNFEFEIIEMKGPLNVDKSTAPVRVSELLTYSGIAFEWEEDPCTLPKACKNNVEIAGAAAAHLNDGAAVCTFLAWLDQQSPDTLTEIDIVRKLEDCRHATDRLLDISFDTICGSGPNGAIVHYHVNERTNRTLKNNEVLLIDSGGQYLSGTTDITRTVAIGTPPGDSVHNATLVLKGMIAISRLHFPKGLSGKDIDALARTALWAEGKDYDHGTGHGVGSYMSVHEGPQRISRLSTTPLAPGMILSNEPGYYKEGAYGIRIENLIYVKTADKIAGGDDREMLCFETLTLVPIDRRMIDVSLLTQDERDWVNAYHARVFDNLKDRVNADTRAWLRAACIPL